MTTFATTSGDLPDADAAALINAVNGVGVMGAGIAKQFRERWPAMYTPGGGDRRPDTAGPSARVTVCTLTRDRRPRHL